jgi:hypothetical protein
MKKFNTGSPDLDKWLKFYHGKDLNNTKFLKLLKTCDKVFLTMSPPKDVEDEINSYLPDFGVLELDFQKIAYNSKEKNEDAKTRIVLGMIHHANFENWKEKYGEIFTEVIEKSLIEGNYEIFDIEFEKIISLAIEKKLIDRDSFMGLAILRGVLLGSRYPDELSQKNLLKAIKKNKLKILLGF